MGHVSWTVTDVWLCGLCFMLSLLMVSSSGHGAFRIDTHTHYIPPFYRQLLAEKNLMTAGFPMIPEWSAQTHLARNELLQIETSILSVSTPGAKLSPQEPIEDGRRLARQLNEYGYNLTHEHPRSFKFFATLTLPDVEGAVAEAIYALDTLNASGVILLANTFGEVLGSPREDSLFQVLNERRAIAFIHPSDCPCSPTSASTEPVSDRLTNCVNPTTEAGLIWNVGLEPISEFNGFNSLVSSVRAGQTDEADVESSLPPFVVDFLLDTTRAATNLVFRNVSGRYPNIRFILAHSGGFLPFAAFRIASALSLLKNTARDDIIQQLRTMHVDLAVSATPTALPSTLAFYRDTHLMFGSDFPFVPLHTALQNSAGVDNSTMSADIKDQVNFRNARSLLRSLTLPIISTGEVHRSTTTGSPQPHDEFTDIRDHSSGKRSNAD